MSEVVGRHNSSRQQTICFDLPAAEALKERGMDLAASTHQDILETARSIARDIAKSNGVVTADDVQRVLKAKARLNIVKRSVIVQFVVGHDIVGTEPFTTFRASTRADMSTSSPFA